MIYITIASNLLFFLFHLACVVLFTAVASCAHVVALERTEHGPFTRDDAIPTNQWTLENVLAAIDASKSKFGGNTKDTQSSVSTVRTSTRNKGI